MVCLCTAGARTTRRRLAWNLGGAPRMASTTRLTIPEPPGLDDYLESK